MSTYNSPVDVQAATLVRSSNINDLDAATANAFALLPDETLLKQGKVMYAVDTGTANTYLAELPVSPASYADGLALTFKAVNANSGACTINVNSMGVKSIAREDGTALVTGDIVAGQMCTVRYSTTSGKFQLEGTNASASATAAAASAATATSQASAASASASTASTQASNASSSASSASTSASMAANYVTVGTSSSSVAIATGSKSFTATTGKAWGAGQFLSLSSAANSANYMHGTVTSYNSGTGALVMNILNIGGSGTLADWNIAIAGTQGPTGIGISPQAVGFTVSGGTTSKTLIVANDANVSGTNTGDQTPASLGLVIGTNVQAYDADLTTWAGVTPGTGVAAALAVAVGSAGAPVLFNGAGGTPSSMTGTNISGTASGLTAGVATVANGIKSATTTVAVSSATAPTAGQVLTATASTSATWQTPAGGSIVRSARTSNTILASADRETLIDITSGTFSQTFTAAATLGSGWYCYIRNSGTGDITLDPNSAELIDGLSSYVMYGGETRLVQCTGTAFVSVVLSPFFKSFTNADFLIVSGHKRLLLATILCKFINRGCLYPKF